MHEQTSCCDKAANQQLPIAPAFWIIRIVSSEECSSLTQNLMHICCSTSSVIFNVTATQYTCLLNGIYRPHWIVQWSCHCSLTCIPGYSPWLPGYITQTVLVILTMAAVFPDRPHTSTHQVHSTQYPCVYGKFSNSRINANWLTGGGSACTWIRTTEVLCFLFSEQFYRWP